ncbi:multiple epidermal growth factor-like domains protein 9 [Anguilla rostrata]|uniref:multiple epidermal growth factor-like domains protein 9 n=1 Tax=Anguilla rostrata TaxID=7938 RepID=UPI0030D36E88
MKCGPVIMFVPPVLELVLFLCTIGLSNSAPHLKSKDASPAWRHPRAALEITGEPLSTSIPSHLSEDKSEDATIAGLTPAPTTTVAGRTAGVTVQPSATATIAPTIVPRKTLHPITKNGDAVTGLIHTTSALASTIVHSLDKTARQTTLSAVSENSWSTKDTASPLDTTTKSRQALLCNCSSEGVLDPEDCDGETGQCSCLQGYMGLQCEDCEEDHFTNGSTGCQPCGCDSFGAVDVRCNSSGACVCKTGVFGPKCDDCYPGYFRFSSTGCQTCQCNNHSSYCHPQSGICLDCQDNTKGPGCEECGEGFYRRPGAALTDACIACPCALNTSTGTCHSGSSGGAVCEQCRAEYQGPLCDRCGDGFFRSDGACRPCDCSGNADAAATPSLCHPETGRCLSCANHTAGPRCERCADGFAGNALAHTCTPTVHVTATTTPVTTITGDTATTTAMATTTNSTGGRTSAATTQSLLTSLGGPTDNATTTVSEVSWAQFNVVVLAVIIVAVVLLMGAAGGFYSYREYRNRKLNAPFWTIELKEDNISFSSYHDSIPNADVSGLLEDEPGEAPPNGQLALSSPRNVYKP